MDNGEMRPRQLAKLMIAEFVSGGQIQINPDDYPKAIRGTAIVLARNAAALIVYHAREARKNPGHIMNVNQNLAATIRHYNATRQQREAPK